ncbi:Protein transport protein Sec31A [Hordeum vulgare]|nr:Protein transport protein Sec31A [Hordeum vulgare]
MSMPRSRGRSSRTGHKDWAREPLRFDQQIKDAEDLAMLVIPPKFVLVNKWSEFWVQVQNFEGHMVLGWGWKYFCSRHRIVPGELLVLGI